MDEILQEFSDHVKVKELFWNKKVVESEQLEENRSEFLRNMLEYEHQEKGEEHPIIVIFMEPDNHTIPG